MKSREERQAEFERREAERKAKYAERMGRIRERGAELDAEVAEQRAERRERQRVEDEALLQQSAVQAGGLGPAEGPGATFVNIADMPRQVRVMGALIRKARRR
jgi:hypothetical protein